MACPQIDWGERDNFVYLIRNKPKFQVWNTERDAYAFQTAVILQSRKNDLNYTRPLNILVQQLHCFFHLLSSADLIGVGALFIAIEIDQNCLLSQSTHSLPRCSSLSHFNCSTSRQGKLWILLQEKIFFDLPRYKMHTCSY